MSDEFGAEVITVVISHENLQLVLYFLDNVIHQLILCQSEVVLEKFRANFLGGKMENMSSECFVLLEWIFLCHFDFVLDLLHEIIV